MATALGSRVHKPSRGLPAKHADSCSNFEKFLYTSCLVPSLRHAFVYARDIIFKRRVTSSLVFKCSVSPPSASEGQPSLLRMIFDNVLITIYIYIFFMLLINYINYISIKHLIQI